MPFLWTNNKVAVELEELVPRFWNSENSLYSELYRYKNKPFGIKRLQSGGNGRKMLIDFDTLKDEIQEALGDPRKVDNPLQLFFEFDADAVEYYSKFKRNGIALTSEEQERYIINASVDRYVCEIMEMPRYNRATAEQTDQDKEAYALQSAYTATIEAFAKEQLNKIENVGVIDRTPKTVNRNFSFSNLRRFEVKEVQEVEVFEDETEEMEYQPKAQSNINGWRSAFQ